jgi:hypothetical protein
VWKKDLMELVPNGVELTPMINELQREGQILVMRSLTGKFKDWTLPPLGRPYANGEAFDAGGAERWRTFWWDDLKERNRTAPRAEDGEFNWTHRWGNGVADCCSRVCVRVGRR